MHGPVCRAVADIEVVNGVAHRAADSHQLRVASFRGLESPRDLIAEAEDQMYMDKSMSPHALVGHSGAARCGRPPEGGNLKALGTS